jgi:hypothetical protein
MKLKKHDEYIIQSSATKMESPRCKAAWRHLGDEDGVVSFGRKALCAIFATVHDWLRKSGWEFDKYYVLWIF